MATEQKKQFNPTPKEKFYFDEKTGEYFDEAFDDFASETDFDIEEDDYEY